MSRSQSSRIDRILAVDDSPDNLFLIQTILDDKGYEITLAENGQSALAQIEKNPPDLILSDTLCQCPLTPFCQIKFHLLHLI
ncbi:response regulator [Leptolyngbya sp. 7M]|uniref:response regulator n=1 Tax=Leptolyngbya sp. 7M TaxID=2812896 RepID=UPI001B8D0D9F|nr:response regulator [Leptolyngbya sp. 7M]QYO64097.1 response regulator [Leptolyngbya sp. 7M]